MGNDCGVEGDNSNQIAANGEKMEEMIGPERDRYRKGVTRRTSKRYSSGHESQGNI